MLFNYVNLTHTHTHTHIYIYLTSLKMDPILLVCGGGNICQVLFLICASWPLVLPLPFGVFCPECVTSRVPVSSGLNHMVCAELLSDHLVHDANKTYSVNIGFHQIVTRMFLVPLGSIFVRLRTYIPEVIIARNNLSAIYRMCSLRRLGWLVKTTPKS